MKKYKHWSESWQGWLLGFSLGIFSIIGLVVTLKFVVAETSFLTNKYIESLPVYKDLRICYHNSYARYYRLADKLNELENEFTTLIRRGIPTEMITKNFQITDEGEITMIEKK